MRLVGLTWLPSSACWAKAWRQVAHAAGGQHAEGVAPRAGSLRAARESVAVVGALWRSYRLCASASVVLARSRIFRWLRAAGWSGQTAGRRLRGGLLSSVTVACLPRTALAIAWARRQTTRRPAAGWHRASRCAFFHFGSNHWRGIHRPARQRWRDFPVVAAHELADLFLALHHQRQRGRLHAAHGGQEKPPSRLNAVMARVPLMPTSQSASGRLRAAWARPAICCSVRCVKAFADGLRRHALQPQALDRLARGTGLPALLPPAYCSIRRKISSPRGPRRRR